MRGWIIGVFVFCAALTPAFADTRVALVIGNSKYASVGALPNPDKDAALVASSLQAEGFKVTLVQDVSRETLLATLNSFSDEVNDADWALVYYAGHGIEIGGVNYLLPVDAKLKNDRDAQDEAVTLNRVLDSVESAHKLRIVILDACRNNPFATAMKRSVKVRAVERGLAPVEPQSGTLVVYAAAAGQVAEDGAGEHSPFTSALVKRIQEPGLEVSRLFNVVAADVLKSTKQHQLPFQYGSNPSLEEFYFKPPAGGGPQSGVNTLAETWGFLKASTDAAMLTAFLDKVPKDEQMRAEVQARLSELRAAKPPEGQKVAALPVAPPQVVAPKPATPTECDRLAASPFDRDLPAGFPAVELDRMNPQAAIPACQAAVNAAPGDRRLHFQLGRAYHKQKLYAEAKQEYEKAVAAGSAAATTNLANIYRQGRGVARDFDTARRMYEAAAATGNVVAIGNLGTMYRRGESVPKNFDTARNLLEKAAAAGVPTALAALGSMYEIGEGVPKDFNKARELFEKSAAAGDNGAMADIGRLYQRGEGVPKNVDTARGWYEKAASLDSTFAMNELAALYLSGDGAPRNPEAARGWYEKAAAEGDFVAMNNLGRFYQYGQGGAPRNFDTARGWFEKAAAAGNTGAMYNLGTLYSRTEGAQKNLETARGWYEKAAAAGNYSAMAALGAFYENGEGVPKNFDLARGWYEKAAAGNNAYAMAALGRFYEFAVGVPRNFDTARSWYEKAAAGGNNSAQKALARLAGVRR